MKLIILGPPGAGKDTQANLLSKRLKLKIISVGSLLRDEISKKTKLGKNVEKILDRGDLVPEEMAFEILKKKLPKDNFIVDGAPRTVREAIMLDGLFKSDFILVLVAPYGVLLKRLQKRAKIEKRDDDHLKIIKHRFKVYKEQTLPVIEYYKQRAIKIESNGSPESIDKKIRKKLGCR